MVERYVLPQFRELLQYDAACVAPDLASLGGIRISGPSGTIEVPTIEANLNPLLVLIGAGLRNQIGAELRQLIEVEPIPMDRPGLPTAFRIENRRTEFMVAPEPSAPVVEVEPDSEPPEEDPEASEIYHCPRCGRNHRRDSAIGQRHLPSDPDFGA